MLSTSFSYTNDNLFFWRLSFVLLWHPRQESNLYSALRRGVHYPLCYEGVCSPREVLRALRGVKNCFMVSVSMDLEHKVCYRAAAKGIELRWISKTAVPEIPGQIAAKQRTADETAGIASYIVRKSA